MRGRERSPSAVGAAPTRTDRLGHGASCPGSQPPLLAASLTRGTDWGIGGLCPESEMQRGDPCPVCRADCARSASLTLTRDTGHRLATRSERIEVNGRSETLGSVLRTLSSKPV